MANHRSVDAEAALDEWDTWMRDEIPFEHVGYRLKVKQETWERWFQRAEKAGDPRARRKEPAAAGIRRGVLRLPGSSR
jgi:hypothetical protein